MNENLIFLRIHQNGKFAAECVSNDNLSEKCFFDSNCEVFWRKILQFFFFAKNSEKLENLEGESFERKTRSSF